MRQSRSKARGVVVFPGAGSSAQHPSLQVLEDRLAPLPVHRVDFAYRRAGRRFPDRAPVLIEAVREAVRQACDVWGCSTEQVVIGGRSMGGRICTMASAGFDGNDATPQPASEPLRVAGVFCIGYPLHPPDKPDRLRVAHFPHMQAPTLFVSGTKDEFATPDELRLHLASIPIAPHVQFIDGGRHDLRGHDSEVADHVASWLQTALHD